MEEFKTKVCTKCGKEKLATVEYFRTGKKYKGGLVSQCRECINKMARLRYEQAGGASERKKKKKKLWNERNKERLNEIRRINRLKNIEDERRKARERYWKNRDKISEWAKEYRTRPYVREKEIKAKKEWYIKNKEWAKESSLRWAQGNRERRREIVSNSARRSREELRETYVKAVIIQVHRIPRDEISNELINIKRKSLKYNRELNKLKKELR